MKGQGKELEEPAAAKSQINKFNKRKGGAGAGASNNGSSQGLDQLHMSEKDINVSFFSPPSHLLLTAFLSAVLRA